MLLLLVVLLLMAAAGSLVGALLIGELDLAWASVGGSVLAALVLLVRRRRSRRRQQGAAKRGAPRPTASEHPEDDADPEHAGSDDIEPAEEDTDAADLLVVWELADEVLVVDEHPRYHLESCRWPVTEQTERLAVSEARELGFTPCGRCRPDAALARKQRAGSVSQDAQ